MPSKRSQEVKQTLLAKKQQRLLTSNDFLSTSYCPLDLAISDRIHGGVPKGHFVLLVGGSDTGKSWLVHALLAEAAHSKAFDGYRLFYNNPEFGALFNVAKFFGHKTADRITEKHIGLVEEFYFDLDSELNISPVVYATDSMDALSAMADVEKFGKDKAAFTGGEDAKGSYGTAKAKANKAGMRMLQTKVNETNSIVIIVAQAIANVSWTARFQPDTRSGGRALTYNSSVELWFKKAGQFTKTVKGEKEQQGILTEIEVKRTRLTGKDRAVVVPIYHSYGIDELGGMVDWLIAKKHWKLKENKKGVKEIAAREFELLEPRDDLIHCLEKEGEQEEVKRIVGQVWQEIEDELKLDRQPRYQ